MINLKENRPYTKEDIIKIANRKDGGSTTVVGGYINTDGIRYDLDGKGMAEYLESIGFKVIKYYDNGKNGWIHTNEGIKISTNGWCTVL